jgi:two-component system chemotaxis response regulator CheY
MTNVRVLIVDDAIFMRNLIISCLPQERYQIVGEAANGVEAVKKYKELKPDITIMDLIMPFKSGIDAIKEIIEFDKNALLSSMGDWGKRQSY